MAPQLKTPPRINPLLAWTPREGVEPPPFVMASPPSRVLPFLLCAGLRSNPFILWAPILLKRHGGYSRGEP